jgi:hypothetical protein
MGQPGADQNIDANPLGPPPQSSLSAFTLMAELRKPAAVFGSHSRSSGAMLCFANSAAPP